VGRHENHSLQKRPMLDGAEGPRISGISYSTQCFRALRFRDAP
jgi:hypothetical protein